MKPEVLFLRYAFPCAFMIKQRGEITEGELLSLEDAALHKKVIPLKHLEKIFFRAFEQMWPIARELGKPKVFDEKLVRTYFLERHNKIIDEGIYKHTASPPALRNLCKVHEAEVMDIKEGGVLVVAYGDKRRPVLNSLVPEAKVGDRVTIHYGYAIELL